jgi:dihydrofolate reductase
MRKIILGLAVSLDGYIEGPKGEYDWCFTDQDYGLADFFKRIDTIFMGRKSFELTQKTEMENPWKGMTTYVFSNSTSESKNPDVKFISGDVAGDIMWLRQQKGKDIWLFGGAELISFFVNKNWIDEYWLSIHPVVLGSGKPLFQNLKERLNLKLTKNKVYETGLVSLTYEPS